MPAHGMRNSNQILHDNRTGSITPPALAKKIVTQMLTRDLFAVANPVFTVTTRNDQRIYWNKISPHTKRACALYDKILCSKYLHCSIF